MNKVREGEYDEYSEYMWDCYEQDLKDNASPDDCGMTIQDIEDDLAYQNSENILESEEDND